MPACMYTRLLYGLGRCREPRLVVAVVVVLVVGVSVRAAAVRGCAWQRSIMQSAATHRPADVGQGQAGVERTWQPRP